MDYAAIAISIMALLFTLGSFWWLNAHRGSLVATRPAAYAYGETRGYMFSFRLRFPFVLFNDGAVALVVEDLRIVVTSEPGATFRWETTRDRLRPEPGDGFRFATPFAVPGRATRELIAEFRPTADGWTPAVGRHRVELQPQIHGEDGWTELIAFDWWAPRIDARGNYIGHRNEPDEPF